MVWKIRQLKSELHKSICTLQFKSSCDRPNCLTAICPVFYHPSVQWWSQEHFSSSSLLHQQKQCLVLQCEVRSNVYFEVEYQPLAAGIACCVRNPTHWRSPLAWQVSTPVVTVHMTGGGGTQKTWKSQKTQKFSQIFLNVEWGGVTRKTQKKLSQIVRRREGA